MEALQPLRDIILVRRYTRPDVTPGGILVPESWATPMDCDLWEVVEGKVETRDGVCDVGVGPDAAGRLGVSVAADDILVTQPYRGLFGGKELSAMFGFDVFFLSAENVDEVKRWKTATED